MRKFKADRKYKISLILLGILFLGNFSFCFPQMAMANADIKITGQHDKITEKNSGASNNLLPCCSRHDAATKIDNPKKVILDNSALFSVILSGSFNLAEISGNTTNIIIPDLPPPEVKLVGSVYKKE